jgi:hypothetical protein
MTTEKQLNALTIANVELGANYLKCNADLADKELAEVFKALSLMQGSTLFWVGDFLNTLEMKKGEAYAKAYAATDYSPQTLWKAKAVCKKIPRELRVDLSYSHHKEALEESKSNLAVAVDFLRKAEKERQSVKELRQSIRFALRDSVPNPETDRIEEIDPVTLQLQDAFFTIRRFLENTTSTTFGMRKAFVRAELETLAAWAQAVCN